ncbi:MAG TPA: cytochrome c peroxidase [Kofleriaceae bacterium]|nr:cytochrome c peroxidase [Kofleriaceae bacterium]
MRFGVAFWCLAVELLLSACSDELAVDDMFSEAEWRRINTFSPLPPPPPSPTNRFADNLAVAEFGQRLWFEKHYAGEITEGCMQAGCADDGGLGKIGERGKVSCSDCHQAEHWFNDTRSIPNTTSLGTARTRRNAPSMVNAVFYEWGNWAGSHDQFWKQGANSPESKDNFNSDRLRYVHVIYDYYRDHYNALFEPDLDAALDSRALDAARFPPSGKPKVSGANDGAWEGMLPKDRDHVNEVMANCGKALEAYERRLVSGNSPFDRYVAGDFDALSTSAKRGLKLFIGKAGCDSCHEGETFTDQDFHNTGVTQTGTFDEGRYVDVLRLPNLWNGAGKYSDDPITGAEKLVGTEQNETMRGQFRTKSLRHIAETAPYFHNGSAATLADVVRFYNGGGGAAATFPGVKDEKLVPLNLSDTEISDLATFLESLTGEPIPADLMRNTAATGPVSP